MEKHIKNPNLPDLMVKTVILNPDLPDEAKRALRSMGIKTLFVSPSSALSKPLMSHTDMLAHYGGARVIFLEQSQTVLFCQLNQINFDVKYIEKELFPEYPDNVLFNCCVVGNNLICNVKTVSGELLSHYEKLGYNIIHVKQGYSKCSTLIINGNAVISDDISIYKSCIANNIDALYVGKGDIVLNGHNYGFIGGTGGLISPEILAFFGDYTTHKDAKRISAFLEKYRVEVISLCKGKLIDLGGMVQLTQAD